MSNTIFTKKLLLQSALWAGIVLIVLLLWGKTIIYYLVKAGAKIVGVVLLGFAVLLRTIFRKKS